MSGYTPVFQQVFTGTLHGQWPDVGMWLCLLAMADRRGHIDCTPQYIASVTGLAVTDVQACIDRFLERDEFSRTRENEGRRLELIDQSRPWGWRIVNHGKYREKARLMAKDSVRTESGKDAERKRAYRSGPPPSPAVPLSDKTRQNKTNKEASLAAARGVPGLNPDSFDSWIEYRNKIGRPIKPASLETLAKKIAAFGNQQAQVVSQSIENSWVGLFAPKQTEQRGNSTSCEQRQSREFPS